MKRTNNNYHGRSSNKPSLDTFVQISFAIMRMAAVSVFLLSMLLICPPGLSHARAAEKIQPANSAALPSTSLKTIIVGNYQPYTFVNDKGAPDGFSVDVAKAVTHVMDLKLVIRVDTWEHATEALLGGAIDLLPMMAASPERDKAFDFSVPHTIAYDAVFMRTGTPRSRSLKDLTDKTVIVMNQDAAHQYLLSSGMAAKMKLILVDSLPDALRTLAAGQGDAALMPKLVGLVIMKKLNLMNLDPSPVVIEAYNRPFSFAVKDGNQALLERLSQGLSIIKSTGQYQDIHHKWFGAIEPPGLSWGTVIKYIAVVVAGFILTALALILWNVSLRKQVSLRTKSLEAEIHERKQAEESLRRSESRLRLSIDNMLEAYALHEAIFDGNGRMVDYRFIEFNPTAQKISNIAREEIVGRTALELYPNIVERGLLDRYAEVMATGVPAVIDDFYYDGDNLNKAFDISCFRIDDRHFVCVFRDITDRKQTEEILRENEKRYRELINFLPISIFEVDLVGNLISFNHTALEVFRYSKEDYKKELNALQFFLPGEWQRVGENLGKVIEGSSIPGQESAMSG